ncbi:EAL domain-containing protein [Oscillatoria sp. FACHB-1407]|uniref:EAL domain-containing protein n=1 Tax=Oscillatoria sp. FACHB-1407 TaxID=2692847 RepID=UPI001682A5BF|nr:EAL domain-containing protein [Oscillatoria sp. FACHB-1407]MBD2464456.1 EAL domain-containing protein [Oscillatoria sp. FACHB-1407]
MASYLDKLELQYEVMRHQRGLSVSYNPEQAEMLVGLTTVLTSPEIENTQVLLMPHTEAPQLHDFGDMMPLQRLIQLNQSEWLLDMLATDQFTTHFQPLVYANNTSKIYGYEALVRGVDERGDLVMPGALFEAAHSAGVLSQLDLAARRSAIRGADHHNLDAHLFINFTPVAVYDPVSCLRTTVQAIDQANIPHDRVVFEVVESNHPQDLSHLMLILRYYREAGFLVALDDFGAGSSSLNLLHQLRPDFIKLDMELIRRVHQDPYKASITEKILEIAQRLAIKTVAEGIESFEELNWVCDRGVDFVQGYIIAKPGNPPVVSTPCLTPSSLPTPSLISA